MRCHSPRPGPGLLCLVGALTAVPALAQDAATSTPAAAPAAESAPPSDPAVAALFEAGQKLYMKNCRTCHGSKGTAGVPLNGNPKITAGPDYLIWAIITGPGYMPEFGPALSDAEITAITTYVENTWGNSYGLVAPEDVQATR